MDTTIKPRPLIGEILPGFTVLGLFLFSYFRAHLDHLDQLIILIKDHSTIIILASGLVFILSWIIGDFFDALRETLIERIFDCWQPLWWDFFFQGKREKVDQVEDYYYSYYEVSINFTVAIVIFIICEPLFYCTSAFIKPLPWYINLILFVVAIVFFLDARTLRCEIKKNLDEIKRGIITPHYGVYTRLKHSQIHEGGIGVFAIRDIPKGMNIFYGDDDPIEWINKDETNDLDVEIKKLYNDFSIIKGNEYGCPKNFNLLTISWYLNHSKNPNMACGKDYEFYALRDIKKGEELTIDYETFNESKFDNHGEPS
jgi:hypothetical protein